MRWKFASLFLAGSLWVCAQTSGDRELSRAESNLEGLRSLVAAGVAPRASIGEAQESLADARDAELLNRTLYGKDLTEAQSAEMEAAALRRLDRRTAALAKLQHLVDVGAAPRHSLDNALDEVSWAKKEYDLVLSRSALVHELSRQALAERQALESQNAPPSPDGPVMERFAGDGAFTRDDFKRVLLAYEQRFNKPLPVSADGETAVHRAMGFDHRNRIDVALFPDTPEGQWLRRYLQAKDIPYFAFRSFVPGEATGAHIHIGPPSSRIPKSDSIPGL